MRRLDPDMLPLSDPALHLVLDALGDREGEVARLVGGCVRDALLGRAGADLDLATVLEPPEVTARAEAAGLSVRATGLQHGTVTVIALRQGFEVTSLRRDVSTDGRHATITFTTDWREDAARRDFTINALYADRQGRIFDGAETGLEDLAAGRVRFIGDADQRLAEDHLRLLRFVRFWARFGQPEPEAPDLAACIRAAPLVAQLSGERIWQELAKILTGPRAAAAWDLIARHGLVWAALGEVPAWGTGRIARLEQAGLGDAVLRLAAALWPGVEPEALAQRLRLSAENRRRLQALPKLLADLGEEREPHRLRRLAWSRGARAIEDALSLRLALGVEPPNSAESAALAGQVADLRAWERPDLPVAGADALALGVRPGPAMGRALAAVAEWWVAEDFRPDREACLARLRAELETGEP